MEVEVDACEKRGRVAYEQYVKTAGGPFANWEKLHKQMKQAWVDAAQAAVAAYVRPSFK